MQHTQVKNSHPNLRMAWATTKAAKMSQANKQENEICQAHET